MKEFEQKTEVIDGVEYTFQKVPVRAAMKMRQKWLMPGDVIDIETMCDEVFKHVVVNPKVTLDEFTSVMKAQNVAVAAANFQYEDEEKNE
jgi:hypothetical protein